MAEYIDREALMRHIITNGNPDNLPDGYNATTNDVYVFAIAAVETAPSADVVLVRHGRWIHTDLAAHWYGKDECSECTYHEKDRNDLSHLNYCPNCGCKMDKEG